MTGLNPSIGEASGMEAVETLLAFFPSAELLLRDK